MLAWSRLPSEPAMGHLYTIQIVGVSTGKSSWGKTSNLQNALPCPIGQDIDT